MDMVTRLETTILSVDPHETKRDRSMRIVEKVVHGMHFIHRQNPYPVIDPSDVYVDRVFLNNKQVYVAGSPSALGAVTIQNISNKYGEMVPGIVVDHSWCIPPDNFFETRKITWQTGEDGAFKTHAGIMLYLDVHLHPFFYRNDLMAKHPSIQCIFIDLIGEYCNSGFISTGILGFAIAAKQKERSKFQVLP